MLQIFLSLLIFVILVIPTGKYLYNVADNKKSFVDPVLNKFDNMIYRLSFIDKKKQMNWKQYLVALLVTNLTMMTICFVFLLIQGLPIFNPNGISGMNAELAFNTIISFMTNTNLQHYAGESALSYASQMFVIIFMMFTSSATGYCAAMAFIRGITDKKGADGQKTLGNFYVDMVRVTTRVLLPFSLIIGLMLISQGVPQTLSANIVVDTVWGNKQVIAMGPVAALEAIKHLGTNGGGFFGANSSSPFENPTALTNLIEMLSMMILPGSCIIVFGRFMVEKKKEKAIAMAKTKWILADSDEETKPLFDPTMYDKFNFGNMTTAPQIKTSFAVSMYAKAKNVFLSKAERAKNASAKTENSFANSTKNTTDKNGYLSSALCAKPKKTFFGKDGGMIFISMGILLIIGIIICFVAESGGNKAVENLGIQQLGNMEGKEVRFGIAQSSLFSCITTAFSTGTVNNMHDSLTPIGGLIPMLNMQLNVVFGGIGVGLMNMLMYCILTVFICGLMIGRTPEFLGKKVEGKEMRLVALTIIIHPLLILVASSLAVVTSGGLAGVTNPGYHGLSQILYEFSSSSANNGSGFEGLADNNTFYNISTGLVMLFGRYLPIILQLMVAGSMLKKKEVTANNGTLKTNTVTFALSNTFVVILFAALTFFIALALGPIAEFLTL